MPTLATDIEHAFQPGRDYLRRWVITQMPPEGSLDKPQYWTGLEWSSRLVAAQQYREPGYARLGVRYMHKKSSVIPGWTLCLRRLYYMPE